MICISIVSHGHAAMLPLLIKRLLEFPSVTRVIVTLNIPEHVELPVDSRLQLINNPAPKGFGANHNHAFSFCRAMYFCVLNPDIIFKEDPFPRLIEDISFYKADLVAPLVLNIQGGVEDSIRYFPSFYSLFKKMVLNHKDCYPIDDDRTAFSPDWVAGMFMIFRSEVFRKINGFDERYFLYYEDVDICARLALAGKIVILSTISQITHFAQRRSHRSWQYFRWHIKSMLSFFLSKAYWRLLWR
jgi:GT2 family glycosyltransferase